MRAVVPLKYATVFRKAFSDPEVFTAFVNAVLAEHFQFDRVDQERRFHPPIGNGNVRFDLFAQDEERRAVVAVQHVREDDSPARFHHDHLVAQVEQTGDAPRTVYTVVMLTRLPREAQLRFDIATQESDLVTRDGRALGVLQHRLVVVNPRGITADTPEPLRRWLALLEDTLDEEVDDRDYPDPLFQRVLAQIAAPALSADERAELLDEREWERARTGERQEGRRDGERALRDGIRGVMALLGFTLTDEQLRELDSADLERLERIQRSLVSERSWPKG